MRLLWIPHAGWHIPQRAHLFCRTLAERHEVHVTDWVADFHSPRDVFSKKYFKNFNYRRGRDGYIHVHGIPRISPALGSAQLRRLNQAIFSRYVQRIIRYEKIDVVVSTFVLPPPKAPRLVFDLFDDNPAYWRYYRGNESYAREIQNIEAEYIRKADAITVVSSILRESILSKEGLDAGRIHLIPNAVDLSRFDDADGNLVRRILDLDSRYIYGFISGFGEFSGLLKLIKAFEIVERSDVALLIVGDGPLLLAAKDYAAEHRLQNIKFVGKVPFEVIHHYYSALDAGLIPFDKTPFTDAACPIKLLEYSAAGKPVVSTNLAEIQAMNFPNTLLVEDNPLALAEGLSIIKNMPPQVPEQVNTYDISQLARKFEKVLCS